MHAGMLWQDGDSNGLADRSKAWPPIRKSGFDGWLAFETPHVSPEGCVEETKKDVAWAMRASGLNPTGGQTRTGPRS